MTIEIIFVPFKRQYLLSSYIIFDDQPFKMLISTLFSSAVDFTYFCYFFAGYFFKSFGFSYGFVWTGFFFIMLAVFELFSLLFSFWILSSSIFLITYSLLNKSDLD